MSEFSSLVNLMEKFKALLEELNNRCNDFLILAGWEYSLLNRLALLLGHTRQKFEAVFHNCVREEFSQKIIEIDQNVRLYEEDIRLMERENDIYRSMVLKLRRNSLMLADNALYKCRAVEIEYKQVISTLENEISYYQKEWSLSFLIRIFNELSMSKLVDVGRDCEETLDSLRESFFYEIIPCIETIHVNVRMFLAIIKNNYVNKQIRDASKLLKDKIFQLERQFGMQYREINEEIIALDMLIESAIDNIYGFLKIEIQIYIERACDLIFQKAQQFLLDEYQSKFSFVPESGEETEEEEREEGGKFKKNELRESLDRLYEFYLAHTPGSFKDYKLFICKNFGSLFYEHLENGEFRPKSPSTEYNDAEEHRSVVKCKGNDTLLELFSRFKDIGIKRSEREIEKCRALCFQEMRKCILQSIESLKEREKQGRFELKINWVNYGLPEFPESQVLLRGGKEILLRERERLRVMNMNLIENFPEMVCRLMSDGLSSNL